MNKILIFSTAYLPLIGGAEIAVKELTDRLDDFEFDLITAKLDRELPNEERVGRIKVYRLGFGYKLDKFLLPFLGLWRAFRLDRERSYNIIFALMASQASIAAAFFKLLKPEKKLILNLQEGDEEEHLKRYVGGNEFLYRWLIRPWHLLVFKKADLITVISNYLKKRAQENGYQGRIELAPNGVAIKKFSLPPESDAANNLLRKELGLNDGDKIIITTSRLVKKNAVADIIKALKHLPGNVKLLIIGDGLERQSLLDLTKELALENRVKFLGQVVHDGLPRYLALADVFVRPSLSEGQGISFLEAMAMGVPVVATPIGGIVDFLRPGETGLFCEIKNPPSIAKQVENLLANPELARKIKAQAGELVRNNYDWDQIALKMKELLKNIAL